MPSLDFLLDDDNDLIIQNGDFVISDATQQHAQAIVESYYGHFKQYPELGAGARLYMNSSGNLQELERRIRQQLEGDSFRVDKIIFNQNSIEIFGERIS